MNYPAASGGEFDPKKLNYSVEPLAKLIRERLDLA
jgi:hypothetical protein